MSGVHPRDVCTSTYLQEARSARYGSAAAQSSRRWGESDMFSPVVSHWVNAGPDNSPRLLLFSSSARRRLFNSLWTLDEAAVSTRRSKPPLPRGQDGGLHGRNTAAGPSTALQPARFPQVRSLALHRRNLAGLVVRDPVRTVSPFHNADPRRQSTQNPTSSGTDSAVPSRGDHIPQPIFHVCHGSLHTCLSRRHATEAVQKTGKTSAWSTATATATAAASRRVRCTCRRGGYRAGPAISKAAFRPRVGGWAPHRRLPACLLGEDRLFHPTPMLARSRRATRRPTEHAGGAGCRVRAVG